MINKDSVDVTYDYLKQCKNNQASFNEIWQNVANAKEYNPETDKAGKIGWLYTWIMLDGRFVLLGNSIWTLRECVKYTDIAVNPNDIYPDYEEADDDAEEIAEQTQEAIAAGVATEEQLFAAEAEQIENSDSTDFN